MLHGTTGGDHLPLAEATGHDPENYSSETHMASLLACRKLDKWEEWLPALLAEREEMLRLLRRWDESDRIETHAKLDELTRDTQACLAKHAANPEPQ